MASYHIGCRYPTEGFNRANGSYYEQATSGEDMRLAMARLIGVKGSEFFIGATPLADLLQILPKDKSTILVSAMTYPDQTPYKPLPPAAVAKGLVPLHAYAVIGYDPKANFGKAGGVVTVRNPWGDPNKPGGVEIKLTLDEFREWFFGISMSAVLGQKP